MKRKNNPTDMIVITRRHVAISAIFLVGVAVVAFVLLSARQQDGTTDSTRVEIPHIHGLGFSSDGSRLLVPAHIGLLSYENSRWSQPDLPAHDYMGFSPVDTGFYSSGHPDLRTDFSPLLGLVRSDDDGRSIQLLAFEGESDFHLMGVGYYYHAVYVINPEPNSGIGAGLFYTIDDGQTWTQSSAQELNVSPIQIAVHPTEPGTVALATQAGLFLSNDYGENFTLLGDAASITAVTFHPNGSTLFFGYQNLYAYGLTTAETETLNSLPALGENGLNYIAVNPVSGELAIATANRDIYLSQYNRQTWQQIAAQGRA